MNEKDQNIMIPEEKEMNQNQEMNLNQSLDQNQTTYQNQAMNQKEMNQEKQPGFRKGILLGALLAVFVLFVGIEIYIRFMGGYLVLGGNQKVRSTDVITKETASKLEEIQQYIDLYFYEKEDPAKLKDSICHAAVDALGDRYSAYLNKEEYEEMMTSTTGTYYGIGAGLSQDKETNVVTITKIYEGTPSEEAGLLKDDVILYVDDIEGNSMELSELVSHIRGEEGTSVHIQVYRPSTGETLDFDVERRNVILPSVSSKMLEDNIGYIQVGEFQTNTASQFADAIAALKKEGMQKLVVDLRDNPGGLVGSVVDMLDQVVSTGVVVYTEDKYGTRNDYKAVDEGALDMPLVVLINGNSASASEIFAGAIQDLGAGTIVGTKSFGKGIVQSIWALPDGDAIKLTTAKYFTPNGNYIHGKGIEPDVELEYEFLGGENDTYDSMLDNQIQKAIEILKEN